eukprot:scaffold1567_cov106-Isochrysis_galbana.AAC.13
MGASAAMGAILRWSITSGMYTPRSHDRPTTQAQRRTCRATTSSESSIVFAKAVSRAGRCSVAAGPAYQRAPSRVSAARVRALAVQSDSSLIAGGSSRCNSRATNMAAPTGGVAANNVPDSSVGGGPPPAAAAAAAPAIAAASSPRARPSSGGKSRMDAAAAAAARSGLIVVVCCGGVAVAATSPSLVSD